MKIYTRLLIVSLVVIGLSCSDDSTGPGGDSPGQLTMKVTGDIVAEKSGQVDFWSLSPGGEEGSLHIWHISSNDFSPQTFSLDFTHMSPDPITRPGTGTYAINAGVPAKPWEDPGPVEFSATYTHIENGNFAGAVEYGTFMCNDKFPSGGSLTITSSSAEVVKGTFQFTAHHADVNPETMECELYGTIQVEGSFEAPERIPLF